MRFVAIVCAAAMPLIASANDDLKIEVIDAYKQFSETLNQADTLVNEYEPMTAGNATELTTDTATILKSIPFVKSVKVYPAKRKRTRRIIHIADWHLVPVKVLIPDLEDQLGRKLTFDERFLHAWLHHIEVDWVQTQQMAALSCLANSHGLKAVYCEGLTDKTEQDLSKRVVAQWERVFAAQHGSIKEYADKMSQTSPDFKMHYTLVEPHLSRMFVMQAGSVLRLDLEGKLTPSVLEDEEMLALSKPQFEDGEELFPHEEEREDQMVARLLKNDVSFVLLGGAHDLSDNVAKVDPGCELIVIKVKAYSEVAGE